VYNKKKYRHLNLVMKMSRFYSSRRIYR